MLLIAIQVDLIIEAMNITVHAGARETCLAKLLKDRLIRSFAGTNQWREDQHTCGIGEFFDLVHDLLRGLFDHLATTDRAVRNACASEQKPHVIVDLSNGTYRGTGVMRRGFLVNGYGRRESLDV